MAKHFASYFTHVSHVHEGIIKQWITHDFDELFEQGMVSVPDIDP
jgi:hypothetical protein